MAKKYKPFFVTDASGKLFKATPVKDEDIELEEEDEEEKVHDDLGLSEEDIAELKELLAERRAAKQHPEGEEVHDEDEESGDEDVDEEIKKDKVVDTCAKDSAKKGFGAVKETKQTTVTDTNSVDVETAWAKRFNK